MIKRVIMTIIIITMLTFYLTTLYYNLPLNPVSLSADQTIPTKVSLIDYGLTPVFAENLRFNHNNISYKIEQSCPRVRKNAMKDALAKFEEEMGIISFYESKQEADIEIGCSDDYISVGENLFAAGEGGPSRIINTSSFRTIEKGKILLYDDPRCDYPIVELHELLHVFGFDHSENPTSIMYNTSRCDQRITMDMVELINKLYSIEPLPDASIGNLTAIKKGRYIDFNISILNEGLQGINSINLTIIAEEKIIQTIKMKGIDIGYGRNLEAKNVRLPSIRTEEIIFKVDYENSIRELDEQNNIREMKVQAQ